MISRLFRSESTRRYSSINVIGSTMTHDKYSQEKARLTQPSIYSAIMNRQSLESALLQADLSRESISVESVGKRVKRRVDTSAQAPVNSAEKDTARDATTDICTPAPAVTESSGVTLVFSLIGNQTKTVQGVAAQPFTLAPTA